MAPLDSSPFMTPTTDSHAPGTRIRPVFACVIPAYNRETTVARAIESALAQTHAPAEIIVIDDGSQDGTAEAVAAFGDRVRYVYQENAGAAAARNHGLRLAQAEWVALLDSDDYWATDHLERVAAAIEGTEGAAILYFADSARPENEGGVSQWQRAEFAIDAPYQLRQEAIDWVIRPRIPMMLQASVFHRERFLARGGLWEALPMRDDTHAFLALGISEPICAVRHLGVHMTADDDSGGRLTTAVGNKTAKYWRLSTLMWKDLLQRGSHLNGSQKALLRDRLAVSHLRVARLAAKEGHWAAVPGALGRAAKANPKRIVQALLAKVGWRMGRQATG